MLDHRGVLADVRMDPIDVWTLITVVQDSAWGAFTALGSSLPDAARVRTEGWRCSPVAQLGAAIVYR